MAREIPEVVRAAAGLAATVLDEARKLPETLPGLPVRLIGLAMQHAMKVQQQYAGFVARGDELLTGLRGEDEPGLATFDDDEEPLPAPGGYRESAFDRAGDTGPSAGVIVDERAADLQGAPDTDSILEEIAIDELVEQAPTLAQTDPGTPAKKATATKATETKAAATKATAKKAAPKAPKSPAAKKAAQPRKATATDAAAAAATDATDAAAPAESAPGAAATLDAEPTADVATTVDVLTPAGDVASVEATITDGGVAAPETEPATATDERGTAVAATPSGDGALPDSSSAARNAPVDGYDAFTVAQLRGRLRGYTLSTVQELVDYEHGTRNRAPYLTMLRNRLEKLEEQAISSSPLAPRGA